MARNVNPNSMCFTADLDSYGDDVKRINGKPLILVGTRTPRNPRKYRTVYIWHIEGTNTIVFNRAQGGVRFMKIAMKYRNMKRFYDMFVVPPITAKEKQFLGLNDYKLVI